MAVKLNSLRFENPSKPILVIMHGLLGASRNWSTIGKALKERFDVHILDLRNHGASPHADTMHWSELIQDLKLYFRMNDIEKCYLMGHSLGGKIAMKFACENRDVVKKLVIIDIATKSYPPYHDNEFKAMKRVPSGAVESRREAEEILKPMVPDWALRQFLMTNLVRSEFGYKWQINLEVLHASLQVLRQNSLKGGQSFSGQSLLIIGNKSNFVKDADLPEMKEHFPSLKVVKIHKAGHNVHVEDRKGFLDALNGWL